MIWDEGLWEPQYDMDEGLAEGSVKIILKEKGSRANGPWCG
jgi:hypothetical protein